VTNGVDSILYDPGGSFRQVDDYGVNVHNSQDAYSGSSVRDFISYNKSKDVKVSVQTFSLSVNQANLIMNNIDVRGGAPGGLCASAVYDVIKGIGPFKGLKHTYWPPSLEEQLK